MFIATANWIEDRSKPRVLFGLFEGVHTICTSSFASYKLQSYKWLNWRLIYMVTYFLCINGDNRERSALPKDTNISNHLITSGWKFKFKKRWENESEVSFPPTACCLPFKLTIFVRFPTITWIRLQSLRLPFQIKLGFANVGCWRDGQSGIPDQGLQRWEGERSLITVLLFSSYIPEGKTWVPEWILDHSEPPWTTATPKHCSATKL